MPKQMEFNFSVENNAKGFAKPQLNDLWADSRSRRAAARATASLKLDLGSELVTPRKDAKKQENAPETRAESS
ncbi:MAG: hypothetical protein ACI9SX_001262 [Pseudoalteromonas tetraodonis]|jgi:hypothetical protein